MLYCNDEGGVDGRIFLEGRDEEEVLLLTMIMAGPPHRYYYCLWEMLDYSLSTIIIINVLNEFKDRSILMTW